MIPNALLALALSAAAQFPESGLKHGAAEKPFEKLSMAKADLDGPIRLEERARPSAYFDAVGDRSFVCGTQDGSFEAWIWPLQILVDGRWSFRPEKSLEGFDLGHCASRVTVRPDSTTIRFSHADLRLDVTFLCPDGAPVVLLLLDAELDEPGVLSFSFAPKLQPQWPAAAGGTAAAWTPELGAFALSEPSARLAAVVGSPGATRATEGMQYLLPNGALRLEIPLAPERCARELIPFVLSAAEGVGAPALARAAYVDAALRARSLALEHRARWEERVERLPRVVLDPMVDRAFLWNAITLRQSLVRSAALGDGCVAGYGPAGATSQRPGFAWFFTGDLSVNADAYLSANQADLLATGLRFAARHQRADGKIPHEVVLSASLCDWFEKYPFAFIHGETTPMWIRACRLHADATGDAKLLAELWPAIVKGYRWTLAQDADGDGLPDNARAGMGASEVGPLRHDLRTDVYLAAMAAASFRDVADLARFRGETELAAEATRAFEKAKRRIGEGFWDASARSVTHALQLDGALSKERTVWPCVPVWLGLVDGERAAATMDAIDADDLTTPWGVRILSKSSPLFEPKGYNSGAVWPFVTGLAAFADFEIGRGNAGDKKVRSVVDWTFRESPGRTPEVISGTRPRTLDASVPHQVFSSMSVVGPLIRGLAGLRPHALEKRFVVAPCFPDSLSALRVENVEFAGSRLDFEILRRDGSYDVICGFSGSEAPALELLPKNGKPGRLEVSAKK